MKLKEQQREIWLQQTKKDEQPLGKNEETIPPKYRSKKKEKQTVESIPRSSLEERNQEEFIGKPKTPHWQFHKDEQSREV